jgi:hypothetical protein
MLRIEQQPRAPLGSNPKTCVPGPGLRVDEYPHVMTDASSMYTRSDVTVVPSMETLRQHLELQSGD